MVRPTPSGTISGMGCASCFGGFFTSRMVGSSPLSWGGAEGMGGSFSVGKSTTLEGCPGFGLRRPLEPYSARISSTVYSRPPGFFISSDMDILLTGVVSQLHTAPRPRRRRR